MSRFTAPLVVSPLGDGRRWKIVRSSCYDLEDSFAWFSQQFGYDIGFEDSGLSIIVPYNFTTDFASTPWFLWWLLPRWGKYGNAAVIHDYLYRGGEIDVDQNVYEMATATSLMTAIALPTWSKAHPTRKQADQIMLEAMKVLEVTAWQRALIYFGVRIGGWYGWRKRND